MKYFIEYKFKVNLFGFVKQQNFIPEGKVKQNNIIVKLFYIGNLLLNTLKGIHNIFF
mgnify:CR=1 FL=1